MRHVSVLISAHRLGMSRSMKDFAESEIFDTKDMRRGRLFDLLRASEDGEAVHAAPQAKPCFELSDADLASIQASALQSFNRPRA